MSLTSEFLDWCRAFHFRNGYIPTKVWIDKAYYMQLLIENALLPTNQSILHCYGIQVYER